MIPPSKLAGAINSVKNQSTCPPGMKIANDAAFVAMFTNYAVAEDCKKVKPRIETSPKSKNIPVPGPIKPS